MAEPVVKMEKEGKIAVITIDHPPVNALNAQVMTELDAAIDAVAASPEVGVLIITGAGEKAFVAGADITEFPSMTAQSGLNMVLRAHSIFNKLEDLPIPVIAAINGFALGGGCELAMACDMRIAAASAQLGQPEVNLGIIPGYGGTQRLPRLVGPGKAKELIFSAVSIGAEEARQIGLVDRVVEKGRALDEARKLAELILQKGPLAIRAAKRAINEGMQTSLREGLGMEARCFAELAGSEDKTEGAKAFLEKRLPQFQGR